MSTASCSDSTAQNSPVTQGAPIAPPVGGSGPAAAVAAAVPAIGMDRFTAVRRSWRTPTCEMKPLPTKPMDEDDILDAVEHCPGDVLQPPVHLPLMASALSFQWEEEGLYD
jgi:hypothetical protein